MATEVTLPQLGESVTEGTITAWLVEVGDQVEADQPLFELSSDKIDTEVPAPTSGVLTEVKVEVDETVDVGTVVALIGASEEAGADEGAASGGDEPATETEPAETETEQEPAAEQEPEAEEPEEAPAAAEADNAGAPVSPIVRRMAEENNIELSKVSGTGQGGRITREDVEKAIDDGSAAPAPSAEKAEPAPSAPSQPAAAPSAPAQPSPGINMEAGERERVEKLPRIRQRIAEKMMESQAYSAQLTTVQEADVTGIMAVRSQYKDTFKEREGVSLSPFAFLARAAVLALRKPEHERVNAVADWEAGLMKFRDYINLGIAVDTEKGLLVPNVKNAGDLTLPALTRGIAEVANKARGKGRLEMSDIEGGTFTLTNTGSVGVLIDTPILNYPEVAILGTGRIARRPAVVETDNGSAIAIRDMMYLSFTYDHRLLDGADAARFVTEVAQIAENHDWEAELGY